MAELYHELHGAYGGERYFRLYECEHMTEGSYPFEQVLAVGTHTNIALCAHCWQQAKGYAFKELLEKVIREDSALIERLLVGVPLPETQLDYSPLEPK
jgi:hypothetical protein